MQTQRWTNVVVPIVLAAAMWSVQQPSFDWLDLLRSESQLQAERQSKASWLLFGERGLYGAVAHRTHLALLMSPRIQDHLALDFYDRQEIKNISWSLRRAAAQKSDMIDRLRADIREGQGPPHVSASAKLAAHADRVQSELVRTCGASIANLLTGDQLRRLESLAQARGERGYLDAPQISRRGPVERYASNASPSQQGAM